MQFGELEKRLMALEELVGCGKIPGTQITRVLASEKDGGGTEWCLAVGMIQVPKMFFNGKTIEQAVERAEKFFAEYRNTIYESFDDAQFWASQLTQVMLKRHTAYKVKEAWHITDEPVGSGRTNHRKAKTSDTMCVQA